MGKRILSNPNSPEISENSLKDESRKIYIEANSPPVSYAYNKHGKRKMSRATVFRSRINSQSP
ncbi:unnamed protein product [Allacma fusca]|uniref:Uncharacterized protein n=1 Tax=Allacma fusca TaxID=39272 RepID=A0A8J2L600_9HEXA|nr:unnamed protein product [Allacma fusca]